jgi:hypothetical protein
MFRAELSGNKNVRIMKRLVKVVKRKQRVGAQVPAKVLFVGSRTRWSKGIGSWVAEFRQREQAKSLPAFDSLFKNELPNTDNAE